MRNVIDENERIVITTVKRKYINEAKVLNISLSEYIENLHITIAKKNEQYEALKEELNIANAKL